MDLFQNLTNRWLTQQESRVYLACLELWSAPASSLARRLGENRVTVYSILRKLVTKWIASETKRGKVAYFSVLGPKAMASRLRERYELFESALPDFLALTTKHNNAPKVQFFDGVEGIKTVYKTALQAAPSEIRMIQWQDYMNPEVKEFVDGYFVPTRVKNQTKALVIGPKTQSMTIYSQYDKQENREMNLVDDIDFNFTNEIMIYDHETIAIALHSEKELAGMIIQSENLTQSLRGIFDLLRKYLPM